MDKVIKITVSYMIDDKRYDETHSITPEMWRLSPTRYNIELFKINNMIEEAVKAVQKE